MSNEEKSVFAVSVTRSQQDALEQFMLFNDWEIEKVEIHVQCSQNNADSIVSKEPVCVQACMPAPNQLDREQCPQSAALGPAIQPVPGTDECPHCFCQPCVTAVRQRWLGQGQTARPGNNDIRKNRYKKFWKRMNDRHAWADDRYLAKKAAAQGGDIENHAWLPSVREIMPDCVLELVRELYPNPKGQRYMGHKWI